MIDLSWLQLLVAVALPIAVAIVTQQVRSGGVKAVALAALTAISAILTAVINNFGILTQETLQAGITYFLIAVASYYGFWKPTGIAPQVAEKTDAVHIGL